jgi:uncharacterized protein YndB with AHSA1/START domain
MTDRIFRIEVAATPEATWRALTEPETVRRYYFDTTPRTTWEVGSTIDYVGDDGEVAMTGEVLAFDPPRSFRHTFVPLWSGEADDQGTLEWTIEPIEGGSRVTLVHAGGSGQETLEGSQQLVDALVDLLGRLA